MSKEIEEIINDSLSKDLIARLSHKIRKPTDLREVLLWQEDLPHRLAHVLDTRFIYRVLAEDSGLSPIDIDLGDRALKLHDIGKKFEEQGLIVRDEHHLASAYIASFIDPDPRVLKGILHHGDDVLPSDIEPWIRLVRDADRVAALGFTGANQKAYYFGFRDPEVENMGYEEMINKGIFCDLRFPHTYHPKRQYSTDYEFRAAVYFTDKVVPYLSEKGLLRKFAWYSQLFSYRFKGRIIREDDSIIEYSEGLVSPVLEIEPVCDLARKYYDGRYRTTDFDMFELPFIVEYAEKRGEKPIVGGNEFKHWLKEQGR